MKSLLATTGFSVMLTKGQASCRECSEMKRYGLAQAETKQNGSYHSLNN
jgi:hypothetical protein